MSKTRKFSAAALIGGLALFSVAFQGPAAQGSKAINSGVASSLDRSFGLQGVASVEPLRGKRVRATSVAESPSGRIVVGVAAASGSGSVARFTADGHLDRTFGRNGIASLSQVGSNVNPYDTLVDRRGRVILGNDDGSVIRLRRNGRLDRSFADGLVNLAAAAEIRIRELVFSKKGSVVAAGYFRKNNQSSVFVARLGPNGRLDRSFNGTGIRLLPMDLASTGSTVAIGPGQKIVVAASIRPNPEEWPSIIKIVRLTAKGNLDRTFSKDGEAEVNVRGTTGESAQDVTVDRRGRILVGSSESISRTRPNGGLDSSYGSGGIKRLGPGVTSIAVDAQGRTVFAAVSVPLLGWDYRGFTGRLHRNGAYDSSYKEVNTKRPRGFEDLVLDSKNRIVAVGRNKESKTISIVRSLNR